MLYDIMLIPRRGLQCAPLTRTATCTWGDVNNQQSHFGVGVLGGYADCPPFHAISELV
jgi:hypothetical protein